MPFSSPCQCERVWDMDGLPVLRARIDLPAPKSHRSIRSFYALQSHAYLRYCERFLFPRASAAFRLALEESRPFTPYEASLTWHKTYESDTVLSLWIQSRELTDSLFLQRRGDTWDLTSGAPFAPSRILPRRRKHLFYEIACAETERRIRCGALHCREHWHRFLRRSLNPQNFCLSPEGLLFFLPMHTLSETSPEIPTFTIPWTQLPPTAKLPPKTDGSFKNTD